MMPLSVPTGMVNDETVFAAPGSWRDGHLVRFWRGSWQTYGGWERLTLSALNGVCRSVLAWTDASATAPQLSVGFGTHATLELWQGGVKYDVTPTVGFTAGSIHGAGGAGYGAGAFGVGNFNQPSTVDYFPLTWSLGAFGNWLIANPRGQGIFAWKNNTATPAALLTNAPAKVAYTLCTTQGYIMALGCSREADGVFDPLAIRWCDVRAPTVWATLSTNNAGGYFLPGGGRIVTGRVVGDYVLVWTDNALFLGSYVGSPSQTWAFQEVGRGCGAISPGAPIVQGQTVAWISPDKNFWSYALGSVPQMMPCPLRDDFSDNLVANQADKIVGSTISSFGEFSWWYPDVRDAGSLEVSRDIRVSSEGWAKGRLGRTAYCDAGPAAYPIGVDAAGNVYWHEKGHSADGGALQGFIESNAFLVDEGGASMLLGGIWPDFDGQIGAASFTLYLRDKAASPERTKGPWVLGVGVSKRSFRCSGRIARLRFDFNSAPSYMRAGRPCIDVAPIGGR